MDFDSFLTSPRWEILQIIAESPASPVEIAEKLNTTVSYASQQLKLLDAAGLLIRKKTGAALKGKPRTLFSLSNEFLYLTVLVNGFSEKKLIYLTDYHKRILKIWLLKDPSMHYYIEKLYWKLEDRLEDVKGIFIDDSDTLKVYVLSDSKKIKALAEESVKNFDKKIECIIVSESQLKKISFDSLVSLYDSSDILQDLKGGSLKKDG